MENNLTRPFETLSARVRSSVLVSMRAKFLMSFFTNLGSFGICPFCGYLMLFGDAFGRRNQWDIPWDVPQDIPHGMGSDFVGLGQDLGSHEIVGQDKALLGIKSIPP
jgi:hypothetical protein